MQASRADHERIFYARQCGYCEQGIHFNRRLSIWLHDDGTRTGVNGLPCSICGETHDAYSHNAHPGGMLS